MKKIFNKEDLEFYLPDSFKCLNKDYIMKCIFDKNIQKNWVPKVGDIIVGCTGNVFVISAKSHLDEKLGGTEFYFGGGRCNRKGGNILDETYCSVLNKDGFEYKWQDGFIKKIKNCYYGKFSDFRYVPYPHELENENCI